VTLRDAWEAEAANWVAWARKPGHDSYWRFHRDAFLASLPPPPQSLLDVGCGEGRLPRDLTARGYDVTGLDGSATLIRHAIDAHPGGRYVLGDAAALPFPDGTFQLATAFMSLQDIDDQDQALGEIQRVLAPGGLLRTAIVHPINSGGAFPNREPDAIFEIRESYFEERTTRMSFEREGLPITFVSRHRPLERFARAFLDAGLLIDRMAEIPDLSDPPGTPWRRLPLFLHLGAIKPDA